MTQKTSIESSMRLSHEQIFMFAASALIMGHTGVISLRPAAPRLERAGCVA
jgi:hypothetical protein